MLSFSDCWSCPIARLTTNQLFKITDLFGHCIPAELQHRFFSRYYSLPIFYFTCKKINYNNCSNSFTSFPARFFSVISTVSRFHWFFFCPLVSYSTDVVTEWIFLSNSERISSTAIARHKTLVLSTIRNQLFRLQQPRSFHSSTDTLQMFVARWLKIEAQRRHRNVHTHRKRGNGNAPPNRHQHQHRRWVKWKTVEWSTCADHVSSCGNVLNVICVKRLS